jgi:hypothetical protein
MTEFENGYEDGDVDAEGELDELDQLLVELKAAGLSDAETALRMAKSTRTISRKKKQPPIARAIANRKAERVEQAAALLGEAAIDAVRVLHESLELAKPGDRLRGAHEILSMLVRLRAEAEVEAALDALRDDIADLRRAIAGDEATS